MFIKKYSIIMKLKILLAIIIFASLVYVMILPSSQNFCIPDGCVFASAKECNMSSCFSEDINSHINERLVFLNSILNNSNFSSLFIIAIVLFIPYKEFNEYFSIIQFFKYKLYKEFYKFLNNLFVTLFSKGVLHPKIF